MKALVTELDSIESLLEMLHQNSISLRDPQAISHDLDAIVRQSEESDRIVREVESMLSADIGGWQPDRTRVAPPAGPTRTADTRNARTKAKER
jgi:hypothetical protein